LIQGADQSKWLSQIVDIAQYIGLQVPEGDEINREIISMAIMIIVRSSVAKYH
jgi:hypothetical protein